MSTDKKMKVRQYTVVYSGNPFLLARLATDLQLEGFTRNILDVGAGYSPFWDEYNWMKIFPDNSFGFYNHNCSGNPLRLWLTVSNYLEVLNMILK